MGGAWDNAIQVNQRPSHVYLLENTSLGTPHPPAILPPKIYRTCRRFGVDSIVTRTSKDSPIRTQGTTEGNDSFVLRRGTSVKPLPRSHWLNVSLPDPVLGSQTPSRREAERCSTNGQTWDRLRQRNTSRPPASLCLHCWPANVFCDRHNVFFI